MNDTTVKRGRPSTGKAKSNAEVQKAYRERRKWLAPAFSDDRGQGSTQLNVWLPMNTNLALNRLAKQQGISKAELISKLAIDADNKFIKGLSEDEMNNYFA